MANNDFREGTTKPAKVSASRISVIKFEGNNNIFVRKHPVEDFNSGTQLIVHESQEAIFFMNGQALDTFGPGRYTLETENLPFLRKIQTLATGGDNPFHAEVYFINKTVQMSLPWGTAEKVSFIEPETETPIKIGAYGKMNLQVSDGRKLLIKLVGTTDGILWGNKDEWMPEQYTHDLKQYFNPLIQTVVKANLASTIKKSGIDIFEIDEGLETLSAAMREKVSAGFEEYGLCVPQFYVTSVSLPEGDPTFEQIKALRKEKLHLLQEEYEATMVAARRKRVLEQETTAFEQAKMQAETKRMEAQGNADADLIQKSVDVEIERRKGLAQAEIMQAQGYTKKDELAADVQKAYAAGIGQMGSGGSGSSGGGVVSEILGLGVGMAAMGSIGEQVGGVMKNFGGVPGASQQTTSAGWKCFCGCDDNTGKFCSECGKPKAELWTCTACGATGNKGKFCAECGAAKPELWTCTKCGAKDNKGKFCAECGEKKEDNQ
ncbi:MAG: hypothetical protein E7536_11060 [Ruminococcaceae bacterium]|nr:hypothetical protein [Oscillospiraceae bacterium]